MDKFVITGPSVLQGEIPISGSKNAALPLLAAGLLCDGTFTIKNVPKLNDIYTFNNVMRVTGARVDFNEQASEVSVNPSHVSFLESPYELVRKMRASFYMLGALLGAFGKAKVSLPGGCAWGPRPVDLHLEGLKAMGAQIELESGYVIAHAPNGRLSGGKFTLNPSSVGATVNLLLGAVKAKGSTKIQNAAIEPDVVQLCHALVAMGAKINGIGTTRLEIEGVETLQPVTFRNAPDRIETGTYMIAATMLKGSDITITNTDPNDLGVFLDLMPSTGAEIKTNGTSIQVKAPDVIQPVSITTQVYPGFPTDLQAQWATMMVLANGSSTVTDTIYHDRFSYVPELVRLGAKLEVNDNRVFIKGQSKLTGASVMSTDLRASVSLVMAAMAAQGKSEVLRVYHLDRGYEQLEQKFNAIGAKIERVNDGAESE